MSKSDEKPSLKRLLEFFGANSSNFMGSGLTLEEWQATNQALRYERHWTQQCRMFRAARRAYIFEFVTMQSEHVARYGLFGTAQYDRAVDAIIEGSIDELRQVLDFNQLCLEGHLPDGRWEKLEHLCKEAIEWLDHENQTRSKIGKEKLSAYSLEEWRAKRRS